MKKLVLVIMMAFASSALALSPVRTHDKMATLSLNFAAPVVTTEPSQTDNPLGSIVYDLNSGTFQGLFNNGWGPITQGAFRIPKVTTYTSGTDTFTPDAGALYIRVRMV